MSGGPLAGVRVIDMTSVVVGPLSTQVLADHGADVIKIETSGGDLARHLSGPSVTSAMGPKFLHLNANKRSIVLDLKKPAGREALDRLLDGADVLVWNVRPQAMTRLGLGYEDVKRRNPGIIYCGMFGFGQDGRYRDKPAYDSVIQGVGGMAAMFYRVNGRPSYVPMVVADKLVGLIAAQMIAMALYQRARTGEGCSIEIPMFENLVKFVMEEHMYLRTFEPPLGGTGDPRLMDSNSGPVETSDGYICISVNTDAQAFAFFEAIGRPELKTDPRFSSVAARFKNVNEYYRLREALKSKTSAEWLAIFDEKDIPSMPFNTFEDLFEDPHLTDAGFFRTVEHPTEGKIRRMRLPNTWSCELRSDFLHAPKIGQHSVELLRGAGCSDAEIETMLQDGVTKDGR
jgi:crotonobetainyl-CoA:carnitine CoA-transferase CaiB-like acyl-CoA transferase